MSEEKTTIKTNCSSISVVLEDKNMSIIHESEVIYSGPYDSEVLRQVLQETNITFSSESTEDVVEFLDDFSNSGERKGYWGCIGFSVAVLTIVALVCYVFGYFIGLF